MNKEVIVVQSFSLTLCQFCDVCTGDHGSVPRLVKGQELIFDGPVNAGILQQVTPDDVSVMKNKVNLWQLPGIIPIGNASCGFNVIDVQSGSDCIFVLSTKEQGHLG